MNHIMLDIETLGVLKDSVVLSIGAVYFDPHSEEVGDTFYVTIDIDSCLNVGLTIEGRTLKWWLTADEKVRGDSLSGEMGLKEALTKFNEFYKEGAYIWSRSPSFDTAILSTAYTKMGMKQPWKYNKDLDVRTMEWIVKDILDYKTFPTTGDVHNALDDAMFQAKYVRAAFEKISLKNNE